MLTMFGLPVVAREKSFRAIGLDEREDGQAVFARPQQMTSILREPHPTTAGTKLGRLWAVLPRTRTFENEDDFLDRRIGLRRRLFRRKLQPVQSNVDRARGQADVLTYRHIVQTDDHSSSSPSQ
jgi:hypothetical protein